MSNAVTVALIYDFDGTLSPGTMQEYDFIPGVGKQNEQFWEESNALAVASDIRWDFLPQAHIPCLFWCARVK